MYNFKSTLLILLLGIALILPTVYCFSLFSPQNSKEKVDEGQDGVSQSTIIDVSQPTKMDDTAKDSSMNDDDIMRDPSMNDDETTEDSSKDDDGTLSDPTTNTETSSDPTTNIETSSDGADTNSWPVIMIVDDNIGEVHEKSESGSRRVDSSNNWLVINKMTSIRRVEEETLDMGIRRKVLTEDKNQALRIYRDNFHTVIKNGIDLTNILSL